MNSCDEADDLDVVVDAEEDEESECPNTTRNGDDSCYTTNNEDNDDGGGAGGARDEDDDNDDYGEKQQMGGVESALNSQFDSVLLDYWEAYDETSSLVGTGEEVEGEGVGVAGVGDLCEGGSTTGVLSENDCGLNHHHHHKNKNDNNSNCNSTTASQSGSVIDPTALTSQISASQFNNHQQQAQQQQQQQNHHQHQHKRQRQRYRQHQQQHQDLAAAYATVTTAGGSTTDGWESSSSMDRFARLPSVYNSNTVEGDGCSYHNQHNISTDGSASGNNGTTAGLKHNTGGNSENIHSGTQLAVVNTNASATTRHPLQQPHNQQDIKLPVAVEDSTETPSSVASPPPAPLLGNSNKANAVAVDSENNNNNQQQQRQQLQQSHHHHHHHHHHQHHPNASSHQQQQAQHSTTVTPQQQSQQHQYELGTGALTGSISFPIHMMGGDSNNNSTTAVQQQHAMTTKLHPLAIQSFANCPPHATTTAVSGTTNSCTNLQQYQLQQQHHQQQLSQQQLLQQPLNNNHNNTMQQQQQQQQGQQVQATTIHELSVAGLLPLAVSALAAGVQLPFPMILQQQLQQHQQQLSQQHPQTTATTTNNSNGNNNNNNNHTGGVSTTTTASTSTSTTTCADATSTSNNNTNTNTTLTTTTNVMDNINRTNNNHHNVVVASNMGGHGLPTAQTQLQQQQSNIAGIPSHIQQPSQQQQQQQSDSSNQMNETAVTQLQQQQQPPFLLFDAPVELRTNFENAQRAHGLPVLQDNNSFHFGIAVNGFHPQGLPSQLPNNMNGHLFQPHNHFQAAAAAACPNSNNNSNNHAHPMIAPHPGCNDSCTTATNESCTTTGVSCHTNKGIQLIDGRHGDVGGKKMKNAKEQRRAQRIADLIEDLRDKMEKGGWNVGLKSKYNTLSSCADYIQHLVKINKEKETAVEKAKAELETKRRKLEEDKEQQDPSDPESTTSSLTVSSASATSGAKGGSDSGSGSGNADDGASPTDKKKGHREGASEADQQHSVSTVKRKRESSQSSGTDASSEETSKGNENSSKGKPSLQSHESTSISSSADSKEGDDSKECDESGNSKIEHNGKNVSIHQGACSVSDLTDSNKGSISNSGSDDVTSRQSSSARRRSHRRNNSVSSVGENNEDRTTSSVSSDAAVAGEEKSKTKEHTDVLVRKRKHNMISADERTSMDPNFVLDYEEVFLKSNVPQLLASTAGKIIAWNDFFLEVTGLKADEVERSTIFSLVKTSKLANLFEIVAAALKKNSPSSDSESPQLSASESATTPEPKKDAEKKSVETDTVKEEGKSSGETTITESESSRKTNPNVTKEESTENNNTKEEKKLPGQVSAASSTKNWGDYAAITLPCIKFRSKTSTPLFITVTLMTDEDPRKRCFHCVLNDCRGTEGALGPITHELLGMLFTKENMAARDAKNREGKSYNKALHMVKTSRKSEK